MSNNNLIKKAYFDLFQNNSKFEFNLTYSGRFSKYNAKVTMSFAKINFYLSKSWKEIDENIQIGLIQDLLRKLFKSKKTTDNINLYHNFIKSLDKYDLGSYEDIILKNSFEKINKKFFNSKLDMPHLKWGKRNLTKLGSYNFHTNTLMISNIFKSDNDLLDYVMYHELLHKSMKYDHNKTNNRFHTSEFRRREKSFSNEDYEKKISNFIKKIK